MTTENKKNNKKFYGYTGPVKPEKKSKYLSKKSDKKFENNTSYGYSGKPRDIKKKSKYITKKGD